MLVAMSCFTAAFLASVLLALPIRLVGWGSHDSPAPAWLRVYASITGLIGLYVLPICAGLAVRRLAPARAACGVICGLTLVAGLLTVLAWVFAPHAPLLHGVAVQLITQTMPLGTVAAGLGDWVRRIRWWLATKDRPLSV